MAKPGPKPKGRVKIEWSPDFAYAVGLLASDGCVSKDGRHIDLTSKDREQLVNFKKALKVEYPITPKHSESLNDAMRVQFSDVKLHEFLTSIGLTPTKSKTLGSINVPIKYFIDFFRGAFDGDGSFYSYFDRRWRNSFMFYLVITSASLVFITWIQETLQKTLGVHGHISRAKGASTIQLRYAKQESSIIIKKMYYSRTVTCLSRKRKKIEKALRVST